MADINYTTATEQQLRQAESPKPKNIDQLMSFINTLVERDHEYGTCPYAMSLSAEATFNYVSHKLGVTGFQASCADMDFLTRTRGMKYGFAIVDYAKLLYPQYLNDEHFPNWKQLIEKNKEALSKRAKEFLAEKNEGPIHEEVLAHWKYLANLV